MEITVSNNIISTVCNSLRASRQSLRNQLLTDEKYKKGNKEILEHQLKEVEEAMRVFEHFED